MTSLFILHKFWVQKNLKFLVHRTSLWVCVLSEYWVLYFLVAASLV